MSAGREKAISVAATPSGSTSAANRGGSATKATAATNAAAPNDQSRRSWSPPKCTSQRLNAYSDSVLAGSEPAKRKSRNSWNSQTTSANATAALAIVAATGRRGAPLPSQATSASSASGMA